MKENVKILTTGEIQKLKNRFSVLHFKFPFDLVYEYQVPNIGIVLLEGEMAFTKKKKVHAIVRPSSLIGVDLLLLNRPSTVGYRILGKAQIITIDKSAVLEILSGEDPEMLSIIGT